MLRHVDSDELAEWMAYERAFGPLGDEWTASALIGIYEQLQIGNQIAAAKVMDADDVPASVPLHPPTEFYKPLELQGVPYEPDDEDEVFGEEE